MTRLLPLEDDVLTQPAAVHRRLTAYSVALLSAYVAGLTVMVLTDQWLDGWVAVAGSALVGAAIARAAMGRYLRAAEFRRGWLTGRNDMLSAFLEAHQRGISIPRWLETELERNAIACGLDPETSLAEFRASLEAAER